MPPAALRRRSRSPSLKRRHRSTSASPAAHVASRAKPAPSFRDVREEKRTLSTFVASCMLLGIFGSAVPIHYIATTHLVPKDAVSTDPSSLLYFPTPKFIVAAAPFFVLTIFLELALGSGGLFSKGGRPRLEDTVTSMSAGLFQMLTNVLVPFPILATLIPYNYIWQHYRLYPVAMDHWGVWVASLLFVDCAYYWFHRKAHEINFAWAGHVVHHSSENYNLSTALRQGVLQGWTSWLAYLPLALVFPPELFFVHKAWNTLYQFWVHTTLVRRVGVLEYVFMTPSHHRVHHDRRVHCNYGGMFIIWDRMFGSFIDEGEVEQHLPLPWDRDDRTVYGILTSPASWNPVVVQFHHVAAIWKRVRNASSFGAAWGAVWKGPGLRPLMNRRNPPEVSPHVPRIRYKAHYSWPTAVYLIAHFIVSMAVGMVCLSLQPQGVLSWTDLLVGTVVAMGTLSVHGSLLDGRKWARQAEPVRAAALAALAYHTAYHGPGVISSSPALTAICLAVCAVNAVSLVAVWLSPSLLVAHSTLLTREER